MRWVILILIRSPVHAVRWTSSYIGIVADTLLLAVASSLANELAIVLPYRDDLNVRPGRRLHEAGVCWGGETVSFLAHDVCCCDPHGVWHAMRCWSGDFTFERCCVWQYGPAVYCLNNKLDLSVVPLTVGEHRFFIHQGSSSDCKLLTSLPGQFILQTQFLDAHALRIDDAARTSGGEDRGSLRILDAGAGLGVASVAAAMRGHNVVAFDNGDCQIENLRQSLMSNSFAGDVRVVHADLMDETERLAESLTNGGHYSFDIIMTWGMGYLPENLFHRLLDLIDVVGSRNFVWPLECGRGIGDLSDEQASRRKMAAKRFELVDVLSFSNLGNPYEFINLWKENKICVLQRRDRVTNYRYPTHVEVVTQLD